MVGGWFRGPLGRPGPGGGTKGGPGKPAEGGGGAGSKEPARPAWK